MLACCAPPPGDSKKNPTRIKAQPQRRRLEAEFRGFKYSLSLLYAYHDCSPDLYGQEIKPAFPLACVNRNLSGAARDDTRGQGIARCLSGPQKDVRLLPEQS